MIEIVRGDAWELAKNADALCITTNATLKKNGAVVMGRGIALQAKRKFPGIDQVLGGVVQQKGNIPMIIWSKGMNIVSFPVKHNWWEKADLALIDQSYNILRKLIDLCHWTKVILPKPGCGNGQLQWQDVEEILEKRGIDPRIVIVDW